MKASVRAPRLQSKLLGAVSVGLAVVLLCALAGLASAWLKLSTEVPPKSRTAATPNACSASSAARQEWKNVLLRGHDDALRQRHLDAFDSEGAWSSSWPGGRSQPGHTHARTGTVLHRPARSCRRTTTPPCRRLRKPATIRRRRQSGAWQGPPGGDRTGCAEHACHAGGRSNRSGAVAAGPADPAAVRGADRAGRVAADGPGLVAAARSGAAGAGGGSAARAVAAGDLQHVVVRSRDEIGRLAQAMQAVVHAARRTGRTGDDGAGA